MTTVIFATPTLSHSVSAGYLVSAIETERLLIAKGWGVGRIVIGGDPYLAKVRNKLCARFLADHPDATDLFFLDDDVTWPAHKVIEFCERPEPVVAGVYPKKSDRLDFPVELVAENGALVERDGLVKANGAGAGFLRVKRAVIETLAASSRVYRDTDEDGVKREVANIFEMGAHESGEWWGEDYCFFRKCADAGFDLWIDPDIRFSHRGTKAWTANMADHLQAFRDKALAVAETGAAA